MNINQQKHFLSTLMYMMSLIVSSIWLIGEAYAEPVRLVARENVVVDNNKILLFDLVHIQVEDELMARRIRQIQIGSSPAPGRSLTINEKDIRLHLERSTLDHEEIEILMSQPILVTRAARNISTEWAKKTVEKFIHRQISYENSEIKLEKFHWPGPIRISSGRLTYDIIPRYKKNFIGFVSLNMLLYVDGKLEKRLPISVKVKVFTNVVATRNFLSRGQIIQASDLELRTAELSKINGNPIKDIRFAIGKRAIKQIFPKNILSENDIEIPPILKRGDTVNIVAMSSGLIATARGVVREAGRKGEKIKVVNIDSKKTLFAVVVDQHTVKIEF